MCKWCAKTGRHSDWRLKADFPCRSCHCPENVLEKPPDSGTHLTHETPSGGEYAGCSGAGVIDRANQYLRTPIGESAVFNGARVNGGMIIPTTGGLTKKRVRAGIGDDQIESFFSPDQLRCRSNSSERWRPFRLQTIEPSYLLTVMVPSCRQTTGPSLATALQAARDSNCLKYARQRSIIPALGSPVSS